jgi:hypothetical protein
MSRPWQDKYSLRWKYIRTIVLTFLQITFQSVSRSVSGRIHNSWTRSPARSIRITIALSLLFARSWWLLNPFDQIIWVVILP